MAFTARPTSTDLLTKLVNQAHTFDVGNVIIFKTATYVLAQADSLRNSAGCMIVSIIPDANSFYATQTGWVNNLTDGPYTTGLQYYLSPSAAGMLTATPPNTIVLPCFVADTPTSGYFFGGSGLQFSNELFTWSSTNINTQMVSNHGYFVDANVTMTLPLVAGVGEIIEVAGQDVNGFTIAQNAVPAQFIIVPGGTTTMGALGSIEFTQGGSTCRLVCLIANTAWQLLSNEDSLIVT